MVKTIKEQYKLLSKTHTRVGVVNIDGTIKSSKHYLEQLKKFFEADKIKAILLKINSPGGSVGPSQEIFNEIKILKSKHSKTVIAYSSDCCVSGAYYIAAAADALICTPSALIGSIGVYIPQPRLNEFIKHWHVKYKVIKTGDYKALNDPLLESTPEGQLMLQNITDDCYNQFINDVSQSRAKLLKSNVDIWGNGKLFTGNQAKKIGLVDEIGSQSTVEEELKKRAPIKGEIIWVYAPKKSQWASFFERFKSSSSSFTQFFANCLATVITGQATETNYGIES